MAGAHFDWGAVRAAGGAQSLFADKQILEIRVPSGKPGKEGSVALQQLAQAAAGNDSTLVLVLSTAGAFAAQPSAPRGSDFEITSSVIAGGGVSTAAEGCFVLDATLGQPVVGRASGGDFVLETGFWMQSPRDEHIFSNGFESGVCPP